MPAESITKEQTRIRVLENIAIAKDQYRDGNELIALASG
jgi:hypothetical protein